LARAIRRGEIGLDVLLGKPLEAHAGLDQALAISLVRCHQTDAGMDAVVAAVRATQTLRGLVEKLGLGQIPAPDGTTYRGENIAPLGSSSRAQVERGVGFCPGEPIGAGARELSSLWVSSTSLAQPSGSMR